LKITFNSSIFVKKLNYETIKIKINDSVYKHFMWFLERFKKHEIQVIKVDDDYLSVKEYLNKELKEIESGNGEFISLDQLDQELEDSIRAHEDYN